MKRTRAYRRAQRERIKRKRIRQVKIWRPHWLHLEEDEQLIGRMIKTPVACSCQVCGNPRKYFNEKTLQERRNELLDDN